VFFFFLNRNFFIVTDLVEFDQPRRVTFLASSLPNPFKIKIHVEREERKAGITSS